MEARANTSWKFLQFVDRMVIGHTEPRSLERGFLSFWSGVDHDYCDASKDDEPTAAASCGSRGRCGIPWSKFDPEQIPRLSKKLCNTVTSFATWRNEGWRDNPLDLKPRTSATGGML